MATSAAAVMIVKARRDVASHFLAHDAVRPDSAVAFEPTRRIQRRIFRRMVDDGTLIEASPGRWYMDVARYEERNRRRRTRTGALIAGALVLVGIAAAVG